MGAATSGVYSADEADMASASASSLRVLRDPAGFAALYRAHAAFTWGCLRRLGVPPSSVDDAMQELWVTAHRRLDTLRSPSAARAWLYGIARRIASHQRRTEGRHRRKIDAWGDGAPTHAEADRESTMIVEAILASLDDRVREAFVLSELEGWTAPEIAQATGANTNTIYWRVRTARSQLQSQLGDRDLDAEVIQLRGATKPRKRSLDHCWLVIAPQLGKAPVLAGIFASWSAAKLAVAGAAITVAVASGVEIGARAEPTIGRVAAASTADASPPAATLGDDAPTPAQVAVLPPAPVVVPAPAIVAAPRIASPPSATRVRVPEAASTSASASPDVDVTGDDARLLADAKQALTEGRTADARAQLAEHRRRFATSKLVDLRDGIEVGLACRTGDHAKVAEAIAAARARGASPAAIARLDAACPGSGAGR